MGLPVIATNWSGPTAYLGEGPRCPLVRPLAPAAPYTSPALPRAHARRARTAPPAADDTVGYPLPIDGLVEVPPDGGAFAGHRWAQPSVPQLQRLMRHVVEHRQEAAARGRAARRRMVERYAPDVVAEQVAQQLRRIELLLAQEQ